MATITLFCACGGSGTDSYPAFVESIVAKECEQFFHCEQDEEAADRESYSVEACRDDFDVRYLDRIDAMISAGTVGYDESAAKECLASYDDLCAGGRVPACDRTLVGLVEVGGSCTNGIQCTSGRCDGSSIECGACVATLADGEPCGNGGAIFCHPDSFCAPSTGIDLVCTRYEDDQYMQVGLGEACGYDEDTGDERVCAPDLYCNDSDVCAERLVAGLRCDGNGDECAYGTVCVETSEDPFEERCSPVELVTVVGADCGPLDGTYGVCDRNLRLYCDSDEEVCERLAGDGGIGSVCYEGSDCVSRLCGFDECVAGTTPLGQPCDSDIECESRNCAYDGFNSVCTEVLTCE